LDKSIGDESPYESFTQILYCFCALVVVLAVPGSLASLLPRILKAHLHIELHQDTASHHIIISQSSGYLEDPTYPMM